MWLNGLIKYVLSDSKNQIPKNISIMLGFGVLSIILALFKFYVPGMNGTGSDMREIAMLTSAFFLPHWIYVIGVAVIGSLSLPFENIEITTIAMHLTSTLFAWFFYNYFIKKIKATLTQGSLWLVLVIVYYLVFLIPTLIASLYYFNDIKSNEILSSYTIILYEYRIEFFTTLSVTSLIFIILKFIKRLENKNVELNLALKKAQESDRLKSSFLNNLSHEIRTPLNIITGFASSFNLMDLSKEEQINYANIIKSGSDQLIATIENILDLSAIEVGQAELLKSLVDIDKTIGDIALYFKIVAKDKSIEFDVKKDANSTDTHFYTNKLKLNQIIDSLLDNAFKYTHSGTVTLLYSIDSNKAIFTIKDTGIGIDSKYFEKIFDRFYKIENGIELYSGVGVGLAIAKGLVKRLGGDIWVTSEIGGGSEFSFSLPNDNTTKLV